MTTQERLLYLLEEPAYSEDGDPDGSDYGWVPAEDLAFPKSDQKPIPTAYMTGRPWDTPSLRGPDGGSFSYKMPIFGHAVSGGAAGSPPVALNMFERHLRHILGGVRTLNGIAIANPGADTFETASDAFAPQDLVPIHEANVPDGMPRTQWVHIVSEDGGPPREYTVEPPFEEVPSAAAIARAVRLFEFANRGGASLSYYYVDDDGAVTYLGCRITAASIEEDPQKRAMLVVTVAYDRKVPGAKASIPPPADGPPVPEIIGAGAAVYFNNVLVDTATVRFNFGIEASTIEGRRGLQGRTGHNVVRLKPSVVLDPLSSSDYEDDMAAATLGPMMLQFGAGVLDGTVLNTVCLHFAAAQIEDVSHADSNGRKRTSPTINIKDRVVHAGTTLSRAFQAAVA